MRHSGAPTPGILRGKELGGAVIAASRFSARAAPVLLAAWLAWSLSPGSAGAQPDDSPRPSGYYAAELAREGLTIVDRLDVDLTGDDRPETVLTAMEPGCTDCPERRLFIFGGSRPLADLDLDAPALAPRPGTGLTITQPVRSPSEPICCPSGSYSLELAWSSAARGGGGVEGAGGFVLRPNVAFSPVAAEQAPLHSVAVYYALLASGRYEQAWELHSTAYRSQAYYPLWLKEQVEAGVPVAIALASDPETLSIVRVEVEEVEPDSGATRQVYAGVWQTEPEDGAWRLSQFSRAAG